MLTVSKYKTKNSSFNVTSTTLRLNCFTKTLVLDNVFGSLRNKNNFWLNLFPYVFYLFLLLSVWLSCWKLRRCDWTSYIQGSQATETIFSCIFFVLAQRERFWWRQQHWETNRTFNSRCFAVYVLSPPCNCNPISFKEKSHLSPNNVSSNNSPYNSSNDDPPNLFI